MIKMSESHPEFPRIEIAPLPSGAQFLNVIEPPDKFDVDKYFGNAWCVFRGREAFDVKIQFTKEAADLVTETRWHKTQEIHRHPDGRVTMSFRVDGLDEILWWILGWSGRAKVIKPEKLREMVVHHLRAALTINEQTSFDIPHP